MAGAGEEGGEQAAYAAGAQDGHGELVVRHVWFLSSVGPGEVAALEWIIAGGSGRGREGDWGIFEGCGSEGAVLRAVV
ncbi:hypothetical protein SSP24_54170 [Streptomyces spinoverrucosus]|uniref:Uncharacterized protein n=1 Tax=Streptomyces spinoverrucosus TaxID=284043 RepID=A0A4Y3VL58_9ACTN|nr:hypothetical protein SSP24_54170 [Streptomyces spinoverrucosus]GHB65928.1 hypothetical protein GCM10010397_39920 [Streptomyces spinoverrucosus]